MKARTVWPGYWQAPLPAQSPFWRKRLILNRFRKRAQPRPILPPQVWRTNKGPCTSRNP